MTGTFGGALEARQIPATAQTLRVEAAGDVESEDGVLVIRRIHIRFFLKAPEASRAAAERVHGIFADRCPVYRSLKAAIAITSELNFESTAHPSTTA